MSNYFGSFRRKLGVAVLIVAVLSMVGWIRSSFTDDLVAFPMSDHAFDAESMTFSGVGARNQSIVLYLFSHFEGQVSYQTVTTPPPQITLVANSSDAQPESGEEAGVQLAAAQAINELLPLSLFFNVGDGKGPPPKSRFGDDDLDLLHSIDGLARLSLNNTSTTEQGYKKLVGLAHLNTLLLDETETTDAGLKDICQIQSLRCLYLGGTKITNAGMKDIKQLPLIMQLGLSKTLIDDEGVREICDCPNLVTLDLRETRLTDIGLKEIGRLAGLRYLHLADTHVTDSGLEDLADQNSLMGLDLSGTRVTDEGLIHLAQLQSLQWIILKDTQTTQAGAKALKKALPEVMIER